jgi:hypothetical protein
MESSKSTQDPWYFNKIYKTIIEKQTNNIIGEQHHLSENTQHLAFFLVSTIAYACQRNVP